MLPEIPEHVRANMPWSISKAGVIEKCSLQFEFIYGKNRKPKPPSSRESLMGNAVHRALEFTLGGTNTNKAFLMAGDHYDLTSDEVETLQSYYDQVVSFTARMLRFRQRYGVKPQNVLIEQKWGITYPDLKKVDFFDKSGILRGALDYCLLTGKNDLVIIDHKSGREKELKAYEAQLRAYCLMGLARFPDVRNIQTAINFTQTDNLAWNPPVKAEVVRNEYAPWLLEFLSGSCQGLLEEPKPTRGWFCNWCGYKAFCPEFGGNPSAEDKDQH